MSSNLKIRPIEKGGTILSFELKSALRKRYNGSICMGVRETDISYFQGLLDAGIEDAQIVIDFIEKYKECEIIEVY